MSEMLGFDITPKEDTTLFHMMEYGLGKHVEQYVFFLLIDLHHVICFFFALFRLETVSGAASKQHTLEKNMAKMKSEWDNMEFEFTPYRETVSIYHCMSINHKATTLLHVPTYRNFYS